jgi:L-lysine exporter family protein LysE/ArgO
MRQHVLLIVAICAISDAALIFLGTGGLGTLIQSRPSLLEFIRWFGVSYLTWFGIRSLRSVFKDQALDAGTGTTIDRSKVIATCLALTFLNPHVYLDTVILLGSVANQFEEDKWIFAFGAATASLVWFSSIGFGARAASRFMSKPIFWKVLDAVIAAIMFTIAFTLAIYDFKG